jgi:hypothetical protein
MDEIDFNTIKQTSADGIYCINVPKMTWKCELHPMTFWHCEEGKQPNAFHRFMQRLCFGVKWTRIDE